MTWACTWMLTIPRRELSSPSAGQMASQSQCPPWPLSLWPERCATSCESSVAESSDTGRPGSGSNDRDETDQT